MPHRSIVGSVFSLDIYHSFDGILAARCCSDTDKEYQATLKRKACIRGDGGAALHLTARDHRTKYGSDFYSFVFLPQA